MQVYVQVMDFLVSFGNFSLHRSPLLPQMFYLISETLLLRLVDNDFVLKVFDVLLKN